MYSTDIQFIENVEINDSLQLTVIIASGIADRNKNNSIDSPYVFK